MYDVIECFVSASPTKQTRLIVFQTPDADAAEFHANQLWEGKSVSDLLRIPRNSVSTFIVVDRSTSREIYRVPK